MTEPIRENETRERPILFSGPMVRAILDGRKTQTRRVVPERALDRIAYRESDSCFRVELAHDCPYGQHRDRLWVRESFSYREYDGEAIEELHPMFWYWADGNPTRGNFCKPKPSIHMPRVASRLILDITAIRVEPLQDLSQEDAKAEGISVLPLQDANDPSAWWQSSPGKHQARTPRLAFSALWDELNEPRGYGWDVNPWVWVIEFRRSPSPGGDE